MAAKQKTILLVPVKFIVFIQYKRKAFHKFLLINNTSMAVNQRFEYYEKYDMLRCFFERQENADDASELYFNRYLLLNFY